MKRTRPILGGLLLGSMMLVSPARSDDAPPAAPGAAGASGAPVSTTPRAPTAPSPGRSRLELLDPTARALGATPTPTPAMQKTIDRLVDTIVNPETTLDLVVGRPRLIVLKQAPARVQVPSENIASCDLVSDKEVSVVGKATGTTVLNIWFTDPKNPAASTILSYLVRVFPDPQAAARLERVYHALADEINVAFPNSHVSLAMVGDGVVVRGQARDTEEAAQIMQVIESSNPAALAGIPAEEGAAGGQPGGLTTTGGTGPAAPGIKTFLGSQLAGNGSTGRSGGRGGGSEGSSAGRCPAVKQIPLASPTFGRLLDAAHP